MVESHNCSYTVNDYDDFFGAIGFPLGKKSMEKGQNYYISASWAFYTGDRTLFVWNQSSYNREVSFFKNGEFPDKQPTVTYGDGDGIVNKRSLEACNKWSQR